MNSAISIVIFIFFTFQLITIPPISAQLQNQNPFLNPLNPNSVNPQQPGGGFTGLNNQNPQNPLLINNNGLYPSTQNPNFNYPGFPQTQQFGQYGGSSVAFMMTRGTSGIQSTQGTIAFRQELTRVNSYTSPQSGVFTVTNPGVYFFTISAQASTSTACRISLRQDNDVILSFISPLNQMSSQSVIVNANAQQNIYPVTDGSCNDVTFGGFLISPSNTLSGGSYPPGGPGQGIPGPGGPYNRPGFRYGPRPLYGR